MYFWFIIIIFGLVLLVYGVMLCCKELQIYFLVLFLIQIIFHKQTWLFLNIVHIQYKWNSPIMCQSVKKKRIWLEKKEKKKENKTDSINKGNRKEESSFLYQHSDTAGIFMKLDTYNFPTNHLSQIKIIFRLSTFGLLQCHIMWKHLD